MPLWEHNAKRSTGKFLEKTLAGHSPPVLRTAYSSRAVPSPVGPINFGKLTRQRELSCFKGSLVLSHRLGGGGIQTGKPAFYNCRGFANRHIRCSKDRPHLRSGTRRGARIGDRFGQNIQICGLGDGAPVHWISSFLGSALFEKGNLGVRG